MKDPYHPSSMDKLVREMIAVNPEHRPTIEQLMRQEGVKWVKERRRAGATVFEGCFGPADDVLGNMVDAEMTDV